MTHTIPRGNWTMILAEVIEEATDGDTIEVHNQDMRALAERARKRMCPGKRLYFVVVKER